MVVRRLIRWTFWVVLGLLGLVVVFLLFAIGPVDRTSMYELAAYQEWKRDWQRVATNIEKPQRALRVGYGVANLTPPFPVATAGYGNRRGKESTGVRDSLYVRTLFIENGSSRAAIVSLDMLIVPPLVTEGLQRALADTDFDFSEVYLGATHTHNGIGNWGKGATRFLYGSYEERTVDFVVSRIIASIETASRNTQPSTLKAGKIAIPEAVNNRMISEGFEDPWLRMVEVHRSDSSKLVMITYAAHATCLFSRDLELSRDYPGALVDTLEASGYDFAMFMAGAVASHGFGAPAAGDTCIDWMAEKISTRILDGRQNLTQVSDSSISMVRVPLPLSDPQVKISEDFKVRSWLFEAAFGRYPVYVAGLRIGNVVFLGVPADFSGAFTPALDSLGVDRGVFPVVTGFNGGYIGYLTPREFYDFNHYETRFMNWYAPGTGEYVRDALGDVLTALSEE